MANDSANASLSCHAMDLLQGTLDVLILKTLSWDAMHGYAISRWIRQRTDNVLTVEDAALYQALHRLERKGLIESEWGLSENNRRAKYYQLTTAGRTQFRAETVRMEAVRRGDLQGARNRVPDATPIEHAFDETHSRYSPSVPTPLVLRRRASAAKSTTSCASTST